MKKFWMFGMAALTLGVAALPVGAQQTGQQSGRRAGDIPGPIDSLQDLQDTGRMLFKVADENNDGQISQQEATDALNGLVGGFFFRADTDGNGVLSKDEARQAREAFLSSRPWLRYAVETAKAQRGGQTGAGGTAQPGNANNQNPLRALATAFDTNNDGQLQSKEVRQAVTTAVQGIFATADTNRDGQLTNTEVNAAVAGAGRQIAQAAFQQADTDNNGQISQAEFEKAIVEPARTAFSIMDLNHDGQISQQEAQTARQVIMSKLRSGFVPEASNSPRNMINQAITGQGQPGQNNQPTQPPAAPSNPPR